MQHVRGSESAYYGGRLFRRGGEGCEQLVPRLRNSYDAATDADGRRARARVEKLHRWQIDDLYASYQWYALDVGCVERQRLQAWGQDDVDAISFSDEVAHG